MAKAKLDEASKAMTEAGKNVAQHLKETAPRIKLNVLVRPFDILKYVFSLCFAKFGYFF